MLRWSVSIFKNPFTLFRFVYLWYLFVFSKQELGKIIQKDFFPDLEKLKAQNEYLDAMERNDMIKLREIYSKYSGNKPTDQLGCKLSIYLSICTICFPSQWIVVNWLSLHFENSRESCNIWDAAKRRRLGSFINFFNAWFQLWYTFDHIEEKQKNI